MEAALISTSRLSRGPGPWNPTRGGPEAQKESAARFLCKHVSSARLASSLFRCPSALQHWWGHLIWKQNYKYCIISSRQWQHPCSVFHLSDQIQGTLWTSFRRSLGSGGSVTESNLLPTSGKTVTSCLLLSILYFLFLKKTKKHFPNLDKPQDRTEGISGVFTHLSWNVPFQGIPVTLIWNRQSMLSCKGNNLIKAKPLFFFLGTKGKSECVACIFLLLTVPLQYMLQVVLLCVWVWPQSSGISMSKQWAHTARPHSTISLWVWVWGVTKKKVERCGVGYGNYWNTWRQHFGFTFMQASGENLRGNLFAVEL